MAFNVGAIVAHLGFQVDDDGAQKFDKRIRTLREEAAKPVTAELRGDLNPRDLELYERKLKEIRSQVSERNRFKAELGANFDARAFRAYEAELKKASAQADKTSAQAEKVALAQRRASVSQERDLRKVTQATDENVRAQGRLRTAFGSVYGRGGAMFAAAGGIYGLTRAVIGSIKVGADFETQMARVKGVLNLTGRQGEQTSKQLQALAVRLGKDTKFSASEAADAMYELASAGFKANRMSKVLPGTLALSAASGIELADAAEISSNALRGFGLQGGKSAHVADVLAQAVNSSSVEMTDLQLSLKYIGPVARLTGQSFEDMIAAVAAMGDAGVKGEQAGTSLRGGLLRLVSPTKQVRDGLDLMNLKVGELRGPRGLLPLPQLLGLVEKHTRDLAPAVRASAIAQVFGSNAASGMTAALGVGEKQLQKNAKAFRESDGAASRAAKTMNTTVAGAWDQFQGSVETAIIRVYDFIKAPLRRFLMNAAEWANNAGDALVKFIGQMQDGTGAGGDFRRELEEIWATLKKIVEVGGDVAGWLKDHIGLVKLAATVWVGYKTAALASAAASKAAGLAALLAGRRATAGAATGAVGAGAAGVGGGAASGVAGGAAGVAASILAVKTATDFLTDKSDLGLLDQYADKLERIIKTGDKKGMRDLAAQLRETAQANNDITKGRNLHAFADALDDTAKSGGKNLDSLREAFRRMARSSGGDLERLREEFADTKDKANFDFDAVQKETKETSRQFRLMLRNTSGSMADIQDVVRRNTLRIKDHLGRNSQEGKQALADNFRDAAKAVRKQMRNGEVSTREGMQAIRGYLTQELQVYGLSLRQAKNILKGGAGGGQYGDPDANKGREGGALQQRGGRVGRQQGGWLGAKGMIGPDSIEVSPGYYAAPGEYYAKGPDGGAVINRHQAPLVNLALMRGGYTLDSLPRDGTALPRIEAALRDWGGLDAVFSAVRRPHMLQGGGWVTGDTDFLPALMQRLTAMARAARQRIFVQSGRRTLAEQQVLWDRYGHDRNRVAPPSPNSPHVRGIAGDITPGREVFGSMASRFGLTFRLGNEPWHIELAGAMTGGGGAFAPTAPRIPRPRIVGGGAVGQVVQRAMDLARGSGQRLLDGASMYMPGSDGTGPGGGGHAAANKGIARRLLRSFGWGPDQFSPLDRLWTGESGWNENAVNPSSGAGGIPQALPASKMGPGWQGNPLQQIRWGLGYIKGRYGTPAAAYSAWLSRSPHWYQGGGFVQAPLNFVPPAWRGVVRYSQKRRERLRRRLGREIRRANRLENVDLPLAQLTPDTDDDLRILRRLERAEQSVISDALGLGRRALAADWVPRLTGTRDAISELTAPPEPTEPTEPTTPETRPPTPEEIAQGVSAQLASFNAARASLFSTYGSNYTLAGQPLIPRTVAGQAAGLTNFGALSSGAGSPNTATRVIHQTNVFPTPPPEPHLFARLTLYDLQAAP